MPITAEQLKFARDFHARVRKLDRSGKDPSGIFSWACMIMPAGFTNLMNAVGHREMLDLAKRYSGIWYYVHILGRMADGIDSGAIQLSPEFREKWATIKASNLRRLPLRRSSVHVNKRNQSPAGLTSVDNPCAAVPVSGIGGRLRMSTFGDMLKLARKIDAKVQRLRERGCDDVAILAAMADDIPEFEASCSGWWARTA